MEASLKVPSRHGVHAEPAMLDHPGTQLVQAARLVAPVPMCSVPATQSVHTALLAALQEWGWQSVHALAGPTYLPAAQEDVQAAAWAALTEKLLVPGQCGHVACGTLLKVLATHPTHELCPPSLTYPSPQYLHTRVPVGSHGMVW